MFDFSFFDWGTDYYLKNNIMMPENALDILTNFDSILLGAVGHPKVPDHITLKTTLKKKFFPTSKTVSKDWEFILIISPMKKRSMKMGQSINL